MPALMDFLEAQKEAVLTRWLDLVLDTYAPDTAALWKKNKDPFANPVRFQLESGMRGVLDGLVAGTNPPEASVFAPHLDAIVRVRAVQDFTPSQAVACIFLLKKAVREALWSSVTEQGLFVELLALESTIDVLAQIAFDIYSRCRESIAQLRVDQIRRRYDRLLRRAGLVCDFSGADDTL